MKHSEKNDPVWKLLGAARREEAGPFFSRDVVREVRKLRDAGQDRPGVFESIFFFLRRPVITAAAGAAVAIALLIAVNVSTGPGQAPVVAEAPVPQSEFNPAREIESIEYLGELMTISDPDDLDDAALADLSLLASY